MKRYVLHIYFTQAIEYKLLADAIAKMKELLYSSFNMFCILDTNLAFASVELIN